MEMKKSFLIIMLLVISTHIYLFAQLKTQENKIVVAPKPTNQVKQINLKNVVLKKQEIKPVEEVIKKIEKEEIKKKLPKTQSKNIIKTVEKKRKKKQKKVEKIIEKKPELIKPIKEVAKKKVVEQVIKTKPAQIKEEVNPDVLKAIENEYLLKLRKLIEENKRYPNSAKRLNQTGKVYLSFTISKNGEIKNVFISKDSKFKKLNDATKEIMTKIKSFEPIPNKLNKTYWDITVPVIYQIIRS